MEREDPLRVAQEDLAKVGAGAGITALGEIIFNLLRYGASLIITRFAGASVFGILSISMALCEIGRILSKAGMDHGLVRFFPLYCIRGDGSRFRGILLFTVRTALLLGVLAGGVLFFLSWWIQRRFYPDIPSLGYALRWLAATVPLSTLLLLFLAGLQGIQNIKARILVEKILQPLSRIVLLLLFFAAGLRLSGVLFAVLIHYALCLFLAALFFKRRAPSLKGMEEPKAETGKILSFCLPLSLEGFLNFLMRSIDILMLGYFLGNASEVGIYTAAAHLTPAVAFPLASLSMMFAPLISEIHGRNEMERLNSLFKTVTGWGISFSLPIFGLFLLFPAFVMGIFGKAFVMGASCLVVLSLGEFINAAVGPVGYFLMMTGKPKVNLINSIFMCGLNAGLNILLIPRYGLMGAAGATGSSIALINLLRLAEVYFFYRILPFRANAVKPFLAFLGAAPVILACKAVGFPAGGGVEGALILLFFGIYFGLLLLLGFQREYKAVLDKFAGKG